MMDYVILLMSMIASIGGIYLGFYIANVIEYRKACKLLDYIAKHGMPKKGQP